MCIERGLHEVAVVGLVVGLEGNIAVGGEQVFHGDIADETALCIVFLSVAEVAAYQQTVVQQFAAQQALHIHVSPSVVASLQVGANAPFAVSYGVCNELVELLRQGAAHYGVHGNLALCSSLGVSVEESSQAQKVDGLHVALLLGAHYGAHHLPFVLAGIGQVKVECNGRLFGSASQVQYAINACLGESQRTGCEVVQRHIAHAVHGLQVQSRLHGIAAEHYRAVGLELEIASYDVLQTQAVDTVLDVVCAIDVEPSLVVVVGHYPAPSL